MSSSTPPAEAPAAALMQAFWALAAADEAPRVAAAETLVALVAAAQTPQQAEGRLLGEDAAYALRRLVRGLASPRECARQVGYIIHPHPRIDALE